MSQAPRRPLKVLNRAIPHALRDAQHDPDRLCPMLAGASCIRPQRGQALLVVRTVNADLEVQAPKALLDQVFEQCDGTRTINEILAQQPTESTRQELAEFIQFLLDQGALIDANLACAQAVRYGFQFSPFGQAAATTLTHEVCTRFLWNCEQAPQVLPVGTATVPSAPLAGLFEQRVTQYTFDDRPLGASVLHQLLWSIAGVVSVRHPRIDTVMPQRTLASAGGMHLLTVYVALRRTVGPHGPGVYRVDYPGERRIALTLVNTDLTALPLAFSKPWQLHYATGAVFIAADPTVGALRYRSRSLQYLFMEAGAALHNMALTAPALGLGQATIGGYFEEASAHLCGLQAQELVLGTAIFGPLATPEQIAAVARSPELGFCWVSGASGQYRMGFHMARAQVKSEANDRPYTWGRDTDPWLAMRKAVAEAIEREGYTQPRGIQRGRLADIPGAIDPCTQIRYSEAQYNTPGFPYRHFEPDQIHAWASAVDLITGDPAHVLAELVFSRDSLAAQGHDVSRPITQVTSSGCAAGTTVQDATERALREVIERDAFMQHWLSQTPGQLVPAAQWPGAIQKRLQALVAVGCKVELHKLNSPALHVAMVAVQHEAQHFTTLGMAASHHFTQATEAALDEAEARVYAWLHGHQGHVTQPEQVSTTEHHFELYGLKRYYRRADRVLFPLRAQVTTAWPRPLTQNSLPKILQKLKGAGLRPLAVDITPRLHAVDQGRTPLSVVKVLIPGLLPISFGYQTEPLGMGAQVHRGGLLPHPFP